MPFVIIIYYFISLLPLFKTFFGGRVTIPMDIRLPEYVLSVFRALEARGYEAYLVGGGVRDIIMGRRPKDWDVCTNALPEAVTDIFPGSRPTGIKHGTVTVITRGRGVEVTTYRTDGAYADHRRPDNVEFISELWGDLARRDFTMNAVAMDSGGEKFDPFGGEADIKARLIRCVGDPDARFEEDALRMLRALRFSALMAFEIEERTMAAVIRKAGLIKHVAPERISAELGKVLLSRRPEAASLMLEISVLGGKDAFSSDTRLKRMRYLPKNAAMRWAALCAIMARRGLIDDTKGFLLSLRLDSYTVRHAAAGCALSLSRPLSSPLDLKRLIAENGDETAMCAVSAAYALHGGGIMRTMREVQRSGECCRVSELAITGGELVGLGFSGKAVGEALKKLLDRVIIRPDDNEKESLINLARSFPRD